MTVVLYILYIVLVLVGHQGQVMLAGVPVPGATVTAIQGEKKFVAITDQRGIYAFPELGDGVFKIQVEMLGFSSIQQEVSVPNVEFELTMLPIDAIEGEVVRGALPPTTSANPTTGATRQRQASFQRTQINASTTGGAVANDQPSQSSAFANLSPEDLNQRAADGFLINGSLNNGAASPFAQSGAFGNNRRRRPLYTGAANIVIDNSALNARSYSLTGQNTPRPAYNRFTGGLSIGGPLRLPGVRFNNAPTFFLGYQRTQNRNAVNAIGRLPTAAERNGDFSHTLDPQGNPVALIDPLTRLPFVSNIIPRDRISLEAQALMPLFPLPNFTDSRRYNYQVPVIDTAHQDAVQARVNKPLNSRNQIAANVDIQTTRSDSASLFAFLDTNRSSAINGAVQWTTRPSSRFSATFRYQLNRQSARLTPFFANQINVSGLAGIHGNNQEAPNWGPPTLTFAGGTTALNDGQYAFNRTQNHTLAYNSFWNRGRHNLTFGADMRRYQFNVLSQQDPRGTFTFVGNRTGSDFASFLLGIPDTSSIAFGNADKYFRQNFYNASIEDDWKLKGSLTLKVGVRWEYEQPIRELRGRMVNLGTPSDFSSVTPVVGNGPVRSDVRGVQPRLSFAWRPIAASSLIIRGGYGIYRNTNVYQAIATQMAQQPPLSKSFSVPNTEASLTLANAFVNANAVTPNTFAVDPNFRVGFVQSWQVSVQRDLPAALQMTALYLGTKGSRLPQEFLPNTFPTGALQPSGYVYLTSQGRSIRNAGQIQLRRRLRSGFAATTQYTYAKAFDNAPLLAGGVVTANQGGTAIAQNWRDLGAEWAPSSFDQRHQFTVQGQYTTGVGLRGGALLSGWRGALLKEWTVASQLTIGSGSPQTPIYFAPVPGTGITGNLRPDVTGVSSKDAPPGYFLNPAAFRAPAAGQWGNAGRNSITGPSQFSLNASLVRSLPWRDRYNIDLSINATNVLNHVTFRSWNTTVNSAQFGLPNPNVNPMRSLQTTLRLRY